MNRFLISSELLGPCRFKKKSLQNMPQWWAITTGFSVKSDIKIMAILDCILGYVHVMNHQCISQNKVVK